MAPPTWPSVAPSDAPARRADFVLSDGARRVAILFLVLGLLATAGEIALGAAFAAAGTSNIRNANTLAADFRTFSTSFNALTQDANTNCHSLDCVEGDGREQVAALQSFGQEVGGLNLGSPYSTTAGQIESDVDVLVNGYVTIYKAPNVAAFQALVLAHRSDLNTATTHLNSDVALLVGQLSGT